MIAEWDNSPNCPTLLPCHARSSAFHDLFDFGQGCHRSVTRRRHRQRAVSRAVFDCELRLLLGQEAVDQSGRERIAAAIGPAIAARSYEVDQAFADRLAADDPANERFFCDGPAGKPHFDLEAYVAARLAAAGVRTVEALGLDTYGQPERFFSYRRATHRGEADYGRQISLIGLPR